MIEYVTGFGFAIVAGLVLWNLKLTRLHCLDLVKIKEKLGIEKVNERTINNMQMYTRC